MCSFLQKYVALGTCLSNEVVSLMKMGYFKTCFFTNCDKMLNFMYFKIHPGYNVKRFVKTLAVLVDRPICLCGDVNRTVRLFLILKKIDKMFVAG